METGAFFHGDYMEKSEKNKLKDFKRTKGKTWIEIPSTFKRRTTGSGVKFIGKYISKES